MTQDSFHAAGQMSDLTDEQILDEANKHGLIVRGLYRNGTAFVTGMGDGVIRTVRALLSAQSLCHLAVPLADVSARKPVLPEGEGSDLIGGGNG